MRFINVVPCFPNRIPFMADEAKRLRDESGLTEVALSLTLHPEGFPAIRKPEFMTEVFRTYKQLLEGSGIHVGILLQSLIGHGWPGAPASTEKWQRTVNIEGETTLRICPSDPGFQDYIRKTVTMLAKEHPYSFLVDDDVRLLNGLVECFCPIHTKRFNELTNRNLTSEELQKLVKEAHPGDPALNAFEKIRMDSLLDFAGIIREAIDSVDPSIPCGYCMAAWEQLVAPKIAKKLAGSHPPVLRINNALYLEGDAKSFPLRMDYTQNLRLRYADIPNLMDESDTFPQNRFSKSAISMHAHITGAILNGLNGAKLWLTNLNWADSATEEQYDKILAKYRKFYQVLEKTMRTAVLQGPRVPVSTSEKFWHPVKPSSLFYETSWNAQFLGQMGIPSCWKFPSEPGVRMLAGKDSPGFFSDEELRDFLRGPLLLDGTAAIEFCRRGFAKELGVFAEEKQFRFNYEQNCETGEHLTLMNDFRCPFLTLNSSETKILSNLNATDFRGSPNVHTVAPGTTFYENELGGRVAVLAFHLNLAPWNIFSPGRKKHILSLLDKLNGSPLPYVFMEMQNLYVLHAKTEDKCDLISVFNLNFDALNDLRIRVQTKIQSVQELSPDGEWVPLNWSQNGDTLNISKKLQNYESAILKLH